MCVNIYIFVDVVVKENLKILAQLKESSFHSKPFLFFFSITAVKYCWREA